MSTKARYKPDVACRVKEEICIALYSVVFYLMHLLLFFFFYQQIKDY